MVYFGLSHYCGNPFCYASVCLIYNHSKKVGQSFGLPDLEIVLIKIYLVLLSIFIMMFVMYLPTVFFSELSSPPNVLGLRMK